MLFYALCMATVVLSSWCCSICSYAIVFFFKQKTAYERALWLEFRRVLFRSGGVDVAANFGLDQAGAGEVVAFPLDQRAEADHLDRKSVVEGKSVDLGGSRTL